MHRLQELVRLHRMGLTSREIARMLKMGRNTERDYREALQQAGLLEGLAEDLPELETLRAAVLRHNPPKPPRVQPSSVEEWRGRIKKMAEKGAGPKAIYDVLRLEADFTGSLSAVKRLCARLQREQGVKAEDVAIPVETAPGEIAQVDFGYVGKLYDPAAGVIRKVWAFVMVLAFSRHMVVRLVFDQTVLTWQRLHAEVFAELGGVVETVVPDNLKAAVIRAAFGIDGETELNRSYRELAQHYGFKIDPTPVRDPRKKGKVESGVKYCKGNFFKPREFMDIDQARKELAVWVREIAGTRIHGTTSKKPLEQFEAVERQHLKPLPQRWFEPITWKKATVHQDSHILFDRRLYSVPWRLLGKDVWVRATATTVVVFYDDMRVATHDRHGHGYRSTNESHLPEHRANLRHRSRSYWEDRADRIGGEVGQYVRAVFDSDDVLSQLRAVQAIVTHLEKHPPERARAACRRAQHYGAYSYKAIKNILRQGLDQLPLPASQVAQDLTHPRFARPSGRLIPLFGGNE